MCAHVGFRSVFLQAQSAIVACSEANIMALIDKDDMHNDSSCCKNKDCIYDPDSPNLGKETECNLCIKVKEK